MGEIGLSSLRVALTGVWRVRPMFERNGVLDGRDRTVFSESGTDRCLKGAPHVSAEWCSRCRER